MELKRSRTVRSVFCILTDSLLLHCSLCFTHTRTQKGFGSASSKYFDKHKMKFLWKCFQSCSVLALTFSIQAIKTSCTLTSFSLIKNHLCRPQYKTFTFHKSLSGAASPTENNLFVCVDMFIFNPWCTHRHTCTVYATHWARPQTFLPALYLDSLSRVNADFLFISTPRLLLASFCSWVGRVRTKKVEKPKAT